MTGYRLVSLNGSGSANISEFTGYHAETAMIHFRKEILADKRTVALFVYQITEGGIFLQNTHLVTEFRNEKA